MDIHPLNRWRITLVFAGAAIALVWIVLLCAIPANSMLLFGNGFVVALYGSAFGLAYPGGRGLACIVSSVILGLSHPFWLALVAIAYGLIGSWVWPAEWRNFTDAGLFVGTGLVFALAIRLVTASWRASLMVVLGSLVSGLLASATGASPLSGSIGFACVPLHLTIAAAIGWSTWNAIRRHDPAGGLCKSCGYDLYGLQSATCPECGTPIPKPLSLPRIDAL